MIITDKAQIKIAELRESNNLRLSGSDELECYELIESDLKLPADATFTRNSVAYLSDGTQVDVNTPRFEQGKFGKAVMVEEGTENLLVKDLYTGGIGSIIDILVPNKVWAKRITVEANNFFYFGTISMPAQPNTKYTLTYWARLVSGSVVRGTQIYIGSDSQGISGVAVLHIDAELTSEWKKFVITGQTDENATTLTRATFRVETNTGCTVEIADWQLESKPYATSFTDGTRTAETLTIPTEEVLNPQEGTIECWVYVNDVIKRVDGIPRRIFHLQRTAGIDIALALYHSTNSANWILNINDAQQVTASDNLTPNGWNHFAVTFINGLAKLYINGVPAATITNAQLPIIGGDLWIGCRNDGARQCNTLIDDLRISNKARSDEEILAAYQNNVPLPVDEWTTYKLDFDDKVRITTQGQIICNELIEI